MKSSPITPLAQKASLFFFALLWAAFVIYKNESLTFNADSLMQLPAAYGVYVICTEIFKRWLWRLSFLRGWIVRIPNIQGTWSGTLQTTWKDADGNTPGPIPITFAVRQTLDSVSCRLYTQESGSYSTSAQIEEDDASGIFRLHFSYLNTPKSSVQHRSEIHAGAADLQIIEKPSKRLAGNYWTSRKSTGDMELTFKSSEIAQQFEDELA